MKKHVFLPAFCLFFIFTHSLTFSEKVTLPAKGLVTLSSLPVPVTLDWEDKLLTEGNPFEYNHNIARMASVLASVSYTDVIGFPDSNLMKDCYRLLGAEDDSMDFHYDIDYSAPLLGDNQAAFSFASKEIKTNTTAKTIVFVVIRGTPLNANEWVSNLAISDTTKTNTIIHEGFLKTTSQVQSALSEYLNEKKIDPGTASFLITGHSRGAAVANLLGSRLIGDKSFKKSKLFVYTFASPNVSQDENVNNSRYGFIWNIVNGEDIVPTVPPCRGSWKFKKYGNTRVIINRWSTDKERFDSEYYPKMNSLFEKFLLRDYCPFKNGTFIQSQISRVLTNFYPDIDSYYNGKLKFRSTAEKALYDVFPEDQEKQKTDEQVKAQKTNLFQNISSRINSQTDGGVDYVKNAFVDMHASETYLSWLCTLGEEEVFSNLGSIQIILDGYYECAVFDLQGNLLARISDGLPQYEDIKVPVAAMPLLLKRTSVGFPLNEDFNVVIYKPSLIPTRIKTKIEFYDSEGRLTKRTEKKVLYPHKGVGLTFKAGKIIYEEEKITESKIKGKLLKKEIKNGSIRREDVFSIKPEFSIDIDKQLSSGLTFGTKNIYGLALFSSKTEDAGRYFNITAGLGHQTYLYGNIMLNSEITGKHIWLFYDKTLEDTDGTNLKRFNFVPSVRFSVSFQPFHHFEIFTAGVFDFNISDFNDGYFNSSAGENMLSEIDLNSKVHIVPSITFGVRL